ncbi:MAG: AAA family ATPase [Clostridiaceae bacterium]
MNKFVITIGRECGSGGSTIGKIISQKLKINYYDRNLLKLASEDSGINEELFYNADEKLKGSLLYKVSRKIYKGELIPPESYDFTSNENLFNYQAKVLKELALRESYVVIGRCADFVLKDSPNIIKVFVCASKERCIEHESQRNVVSLKVSSEKVTKLNKYRSEYYQYYTGNRWKDMRNYDLCINTDNLTYENAAEIIINYLKLRLKDC